MQSNSDRPITAAQLRAVIENAQREIASTVMALEQFEMHMADNPYVRLNFEAIRSRNRVINVRLRRKIDALRAIMDNDEAVNGWKGDDRIVDIAA